MIKQRSQDKSILGRVSKLEIGEAYIFENETVKQAQAVAARVNSKNRYGIDMEHMNFKSKRFIGVPLGSEPSEVVVFLKVTRVEDD